MFSEVQEAREVAREDKFGEDPRQQQLREDLAAKAGQASAAAAAHHDAQHEARRAAAEEAKLQVGGNATNPSICSLAGVCWALVASGERV
jgi:hypothetical protein